MARMTIEKWDTLNKEEKAAAWAKMGQSERYQIKTVIDQRTGKAAKQEEKAAAAATTAAQTKEARVQEIAASIAVERELTHRINAIKPAEGEEFLTQTQLDELRALKDERAESERRTRSLINAWKISYPDEKAQFGF